MHWQLKSLFRGYCEIRSVQTFPSEVNCSQRGEASSFSCTDVISRHTPHACWSVFLSHLMRARQRRHPRTRQVGFTSLEQGKAPNTYA